MAKSPVEKGIHQDDSLQVSGVSDDDSDDSWKQKRIQSVLHQVDAPEKSDSHHRRSDSSSDLDSSESEVTSAGRFRSVVGTTVKRPDYRSDGESSEGDRAKRDKEKTRRQTRSRNDHVKTRKQSRSRSPVYRGRQGRTSCSRSRSTGDKDWNGRSRSRSRSANYRDRRVSRDYGQNESHRDRRRDYDRQEEKWNRRKRNHEDDKENKRNERGADKNSTDEVPAEPKEKKKKPEPDILTTRTGGAYIPPAKLRLMQQQITDKTSTAYQRIAWEALKKSINGLINKVNVSNISLIVPELFAENIIRGRGMLARSVIQAQSASPTFTHVYASLVAIINSKLPQNGELILKRLIVNFQKSFKRNDKSLCLSATRFIAHLVNQQVAHEVLALEILTLLLENPSDDSVEVAVGFLKECGQKLYDISPRGMHAIFDRLRSILHESQIDKRVQYMVEVMFAVRKDGFKDFPTIVEGLDLVDEAEQFTHLLTLEEQYTTEDILNVFKHDQEYLENEEKYKQIKIGLLGDESDSDSDSSGSGEGSSSEAESDTEAAKMEILDQTETNLVALRRTIYLTIQSSAVFEECAHKLLKMEIKPGQEKEVCLMILDCCAQQRTYEKFYGLLAQRFCQLKKEYLQNFTIIFGEQYDICHRLETNKLRNVAKFFAHLLYTDAIPWTALSCIRLNEDDTTSSSRIFIKILFQELSEYMGLPKLNERFKDQTLQPFLEGLMPHDNPANTRFSINFFTTIGLGGLTDDLREHLKLQQKKIMEQRQPLMKSDSSDSSDSSSNESSSSDDESSSSSSTSSSSSESEDERRKRKKKKQTNEKKKNEGKSKQIREKKRKKKSVLSSSSSSSSASSSSSSSSSGIESNSSADSDSSDAESAKEISRNERKRRRLVDERNYGQLGNGREENVRNNEIYRRENEDRINRGRGDRYRMGRDEGVGRGRDEDSRWRGEGDHRWRDEGENKRRDERDNRVRVESGYRGKEERHNQRRAERDNRGRDNERDNQGRDKERDNRVRNNKQNRENYYNREKESSESTKIRRVNHKNRGRERSESPEIRRGERYINRGRKNHKNRGRENSGSPEVRRERYINREWERSESPEIRRENQKYRGRENSESPEFRRKESYINRGREGSETPEERRKNFRNRGGDRSESREIRRESSESPEIRRESFDNRGRESQESPDIKKKYIYNNKWKESSESPEIRRRNRDQDKERFKGTLEKRERIEERNKRY